MITAMRLHGMLGGAPPPSAAPQQPTEISYTEHLNALASQKNEYTRQIDALKANAAPAVESDEVKAAIEQAVTTALTDAKAALEKAAAETAELQTKLDEAGKVIIERDQQLTDAKAALEKAAAAAKKPATAK